MGKGKYVFDIGCEQHGEYLGIEQVICPSICTQCLVLNILKTDPSVVT